MTNAASTDTTPPGRHQARDAASAEPPRTPAMQQFARFRRQYPDCILFFRMGDFYEMFDEDAHTVHRVLGLTLTRRSTGTPMAGVPYHAAEGYLAKLLAAGFRVALCDQIQDPREAKGVVDRAVTRVLTPGTLVDDSLLDESSSNHLASIVFTESGASSAAVLAVAELSTGSFVLRDLDAGSVIDELARLRPTEVLYADTADGIVPPRIDAIRESLGCMITARPAWTFRRDDAHQTLLEQYGVATLAGFGLNDDDPAIAPAAAMIRYLRETQMPDADDDAGAAARRLRHLRPPRRDPGSRYVTIDRTTLRTLEIERTMRSGAVDGSLFSALQRCRTAMGKRLLREWLCFPLRHRDDIEARHAAVATLHGDDDLDRALHGRLGEIQDVARIVGRLAIRRASPRDLAALGRSVDTIDTLIELIDARVSLARWTTELTTLREQLGPLACDIITRCVDDPPAHARDGGIFRDGIDAELDGARMLQTDAGEWLSNYQHELMTTTGISSLKVGFNKVFGYYIEITHTHTDKVPETFTRKQTLKNAERYITPELKSFEDRITTAETRAIDRERALFEALCDEATSHITALSRFGELIAELDVLRCFADVARRHQYVRPTLVDEPVLDIAQGRHPVLDQTLTDRFVPNDCVLGGGTGTMALITGPNMAGKSTYIRQVALITLLAQTGSFVPADQATIGITDRIFTRIGASDELHAGHSTFMVEMTETANILHHATDRSLVVLDELGRGTSTLDGLSLAWAIAERMAAIGSRTLFATHYHELTELAEATNRVTNLHVAVREWGDDIVFVYRIMPGRTDRSYGIHVAKLAGVPAATIVRANELLERMSVQTEHQGRQLTTPHREAPAQLDLFATDVEHPVVQRLRDVDLMSMTPLDAFDLLRDLHRHAERSANEDT